MTDESASRSGERRAWLAVCAATLAILATAPVARSLQKAVRDSAGEQAFLVIVIAGVLAGGLFTWRLLARAQASPARRAVVAVTVAAYLAGAWALRGTPVEALHLLEYGGLGALAFRALSFRIHDPAVYGAAALLGASVGIVDEGLQWLIPERVWDLRDIGMDAAAAAVIQLPIAFGWRPAHVTPPITAQGAMWLARIAFVATLLLGASLLATPARTGWLGAHVPGLGFLATHPDVMVEYGHWLEAPEIGRFKSRFTAAELAANDAARGEEVGALLQAYADDDAYRRFLQAFPPARDAFAHEARVHLFRRDRYLANGRLHPDDPAWQQRDLTVAWREDRILSGYFGATLRAAGAELDDAVRLELARRQDPETRYTSRVSEGLVTFVSEGQVALAITALLVLLAGAERVAHGRNERNARRS
jgi:hypothetical protein